MKIFQSILVLLIFFTSFPVSASKDTNSYDGNIFVTFLTKVVGKAIGLVGRGILQGLGRSSSK